VKFAKEHLMGIVLGLLVYEMYYRTQAKPRGG
jgi:hypothetical protein